MKKLMQANGNWVDGDRFWGRDVELQLFLGKLEAGGNLRMTAQRRMGKTSLMREAFRCLKEKGETIPLFVDLEDAKCAEDAIVELGIAAGEHKRAAAKVREVFRNSLSAVVDRLEELSIAEVKLKLRAGLTESSWQDKGEQLVANLASLGKPVVLFLDELPILVNRILRDPVSRAITNSSKHKADIFMSWLRRISSLHQGRIAMVLTGSIGLEPILHQAGLSATINNFEAFILEPWSEETAIGCLEALGNQYRLQYEDGVVREMVKLLGCCIPHHVQLFFDKVRASCSRNRDQCCPLEIARWVYKQQMLGNAAQAELSHYEERLEQTLDKETYPLALDMLTEAAVRGRLTLQAVRAFEQFYPALDGRTVDVQNQLLRILEHDGYLTRKRDGYVFVSSLLKDWWKARHRFSYTPVLKRKA